MRHQLKCDCNFDSNNLLHRLLYWSRVYWHTVEWWGPNKMASTLQNTFKTIHERSISTFDQNHWRLFVTVQLIGLTMGWEWAITWTKGDTANWCIYVLLDLMSSGSHLPYQTCQTIKSSSKNRHMDILLPNRSNHQLPVSLDAQVMSSPPPPPPPPSRNTANSHEVITCLSTLQVPALYIQLLLTKTEDGPVPNGARPSAGTLLSTGSGMVSPKFTQLSLIP